MDVVGAIVEPIIYSLATAAGAASAVPADGENKKGEEKGDTACQEVVAEDESENGERKMERCKHTFVNVRLSKPVPTFCAYCAKLLWVFEGKFRHCTRCDAYMHDACFREVVANTYAKAKTEASSSSPGVAAGNDANQAVSRGVEQSELVVAIGDDGDDGYVDEVAADFDVIERTEVATFAPTDVRFRHAHELAPHRFLLPSQCAVCGHVIHALIATALTCVTCGTDVHEECVAKLLQEDGDEEQDGHIGSFSSKGNRSRHIVLTPDAAKDRAEQEVLDPHRGEVISDVIHLLQKFSLRNTRWHVAALNPVAMHRLYSAHATLYESACQSLPDVATTVDLHDLHSALRYATAVYGLAYEGGMMRSCLSSAMMRLVQPSATNPLPEQNNEAVANILALPRSALRYSKWSTKVFEPSYCVITDHVEKAVVLAFRGSISDADFLTDACGHTRPFCTSSASGYTDATGAAVDAAHVHEGISLVVDKLFEDGELIRVVKEELVRSASSSPAAATGGRTQQQCYPLLVTGHSLGAALTCLFVAKAKVEGTFDDVFTSSSKTEVCTAAAPMMRGVAFAPPPVMTLPGADAFDDVLVSVVAGPDVVCRLQLNSFDRLGLEMATIGGGGVSPRAAASVEGDGTDGPSPDNSGSVGDLTEELHILGRIVLFTHPFAAPSGAPRTATSSADDLLGRLGLGGAGGGGGCRMVAVRRTHLLLHHVFLSTAMGSAHLMDTYAAAIAACKSVRPDPATVPGPGPAAV